MNATANPMTEACTPLAAGAPAAATGEASAAQLHLRQLGIDTLQEYVIYMRADCHVCRSEGLQAQTRVQVSLEGRRIVATIHLVSDGLLEPGEAGLSQSAWRALRATAGAGIDVSRAPALDSLSHLHAKIYGHRLDAQALQAIIDDVAAGHYSDVHLSAFLTACAGGRMDLQETIDLTRAMVRSGERIDWGRPLVADKHCIGGLPGNRTTPIVVAIAAAAGLTVPKTSSRAITSPAGTADVMETLTRVDLDLAAMRRVVEREGGCLAWGGALTLSPADDLLIRVERPLDLDSDAQLVASVLSKKIAAGSSHVIIDIPVGPTAKVRSEADALHLARLLTEVGTALGLVIRIHRSNGVQPVGRGIGPALEARDVLAVLHGAAHAPVDLRMRSLALAADLLEFCGRAIPGTGLSLAARLLDSGDALRKFEAICEAQGGLRQPGVARMREPVLANHDGHLGGIDNRRLARVAKLLGAPGEPTAGLELHVRLGDPVHAGMPLLTLHARGLGELAYAREYLASHPALTIAPHPVTDR